jgi:hypothetical protein
LSISRKDVLRLLFKSRKGLFQTKEYNKKAKEFWKNKQPQLVEEIKHILRSNSSLKLAKISEEFTKRTGFKELKCNLSEIYELKNLLNEPDRKMLIEDFVNYATRTGFLTVVIAPALAASDGLSDLNEEAMNEWLFGIGICLPVSADVCDSVLDNEVMKHTSIPYKTWINLHKLGAALIFQVGMEHAKKIKTGDKKLDEMLMSRLRDGIERVCEKQRMDFEVKKSSYVPINVLESIYEGKICEIEATVFGTLPSKKRDIVKIFEEGAHYLAGELQVVDDFEDLLGDINLQKEPQIPNPSYFLTYCIDLRKSGKKDIDDIMKKAAELTLNKGKEYHRKVMDSLSKLPNKFKTKPFFEVTIWHYNKVLKDRYKEFLKGKTFEELRPQLVKIFQSCV